MDTPSLALAKSDTGHRLTLAFNILFIAISAMTMIKPAHASGTVTPTSGWCSNIYDPSTCIYATELEACAKLASMQTECKYSPHIVHYHGSEITGDACFTNDSTGVVCFPVWSGLGWMGTRSICPARTTSTSPPCVCADPYQPDASGTSCVDNCPANMSGSPCACDTGYVLNSDGPGCVQEQYTISEPKDKSKLPDIQPDSTSEVTVRVTSAQTNQPKQGAVVRFHIDADISSGGHAHGEEHGRRPRGTISSDNCVGESGGMPDTYDCTTDPQGYTGFTFKAPAVSGSQSITATCISDACSGSVTSNIDVKVSGLVPIPASPFYELKEPDPNGGMKNIGSTATHKDNHYATPTAITGLGQLASVYFRIINPGQKLYINDASLPWGGLLDDNADWKPPHQGHRRGDAIDIRADSANKKPGEIPFDKFGSVQKQSASMHGIDAQIHCYKPLPSDKYQLVIARAANPAACNNYQRWRHFHIVFK
jgi:hypothetical protein